MKSNERNEKEKWLVNEIGHEGTKSLSESLKVNTSLAILSLKSVEKIWNEKRRIRMKMKNEWIENLVGDEGAKSLSESLKTNTSLTELNLYSNEEIWNWKMEENEMKEN